MQQQITIKYNDGSEDTYQVRPPDYGMWDILFVAHSAMKRDAGGKPVKPLETWMETVADVEVGSDDPKVIQEEA
jgi:hypothetical protein